MHRSTTATALLVSVAVSATVSGCVSVERPDGARPAAVTAPPPGPRAEGKNRPQIVQAPAREALERMGPPRRHSAPPSRAAAETEPHPALAPSRPSRPTPPPARRPAASRPDAGATRPAPSPTSAAPGTDVCALGEAYGNWRPDSPQAVICRETYGR
ncbi:hypothetical protein AB0B50_41375 [Streptomyces sp. NPDC041068]|uniref:hypothetical protein n=1 Tax=Streptomyces sp. NPDC041068 TaxID=3155130 RepID=UPI0033EA7E0C